MPLFGGWMVALGVAFWLVPAGQPVIRLAAGLSAVAAIAWGLRFNRAGDRTPWQWLSVAVGLSAAGTFAYVVTPSLRAAGAALIIATYPVLAAVLLVFIRRRTGASRDRAALLDALVVTAGGALLVWTFLLGPRLAHRDWVLLAYPLGDLLCLGLLTRLLTASGRKPVAGGLLGAGLVAMLAADVGYELGWLSGDVATMGRFALYAGAGLAALHPSMTLLSVPADGPPSEPGWWRVALLGLVAPAVLLGAGPTVVAVLSALIFLLVLVRMAGIMSNHRQALARERGLRQASAALVSAADVDAVGDAVRIAVAQLLPPDTPHGVVLAMAVPDDIPQGKPVDRWAGIVPTRDLDWAVAVRLTTFSTTLRCPMVLADRPAGEPLVGVLHVGAPASALPRLQRAVEVLAGQAALALERIQLSDEVIRRNSEVYFRTLVQNTADVILILDDELYIRYASPSAARVFGADPARSYLAEWIHPDDHELLASPRDGVDLRGPADVLLEMHVSDLRDEPTVAGLVITLRDVTEPRRLERELTHQAFHDAMTGLANRVLFHDRLEHALARGARDGSVVGVLFIDLDDFKIVNDTLGHAAGDTLLIEVANRIAGALRADDTAARLGGDEFAALIENVQDPGAVEETANRILAALAPPVVVDGETSLHAVASIGITTTPEADTADELLRQADLALYVAKGAGKNQWRRYQAHLHGAMVERLELRSALDHAVNEGHFLLAYQPIVDLISQEPVGFEALVRWYHPTKGLVAPAEFIAVAEESGLIVPIGRWVLQQALHTVAQWRRALPRARSPYVSVNVSVRQFRETGFVDEIVQALAYAGVPPEALMIELTETLLAGEHETVWRDLAQLREHGVRVAIDDFGTGYSSLSYLHRRPIDVVKIDKMFIDDMVESQQQLALVTGIVSLAQSLGLTVIAEGIESAVHRDLLARLGCPFGQGYLWSAPVDGTEALAQMSNGEQSMAA
ncbi:putative bifunctional diguanylate cyclase/phosphodiesterase [Actinoplanes subtropicus]|uniref:putative bifunctional diguanylate cyclase/phosphodiesterase n=1 Tax=Actinoplanes subtropicus TaxID=543632 RepID=UPI0004C2C584|nr:EAL domain-containing protein [Actinoplanes subtropicus]